MVFQIPSLSKTCRHRHKVQEDFASPTRFVAMVEKFREAKKQEIRDMGFGGFLESQVTELPGDLCKWLVDKFDPQAVLHIK